MTSATQNLLILFFVTSFCFFGMTSTVVLELTRSRWKSLLLGTVFLFPLVFFRGHELYWILFVQQLVVVFGTRGLIAGDSPALATLNRRTFSLSTFFSLVLWVAMLVAVFCGTRSCGVFQWMNVVMIGLTSGACILLSALVVLHSSKRRRFVALLFVVSGSLLLSRFDMLLPSLCEAWEWDQSPISSVSMLGTKWTEQLGSQGWGLIFPTLFLTGLPAYWLIYRCLSDDEGRSKKIYATGLLVVHWLLVGCFPAFVFSRLLNPGVKLQASYGPNEGYDTLVESGRVLDSSPLLSLSALPGSVSEAEQEMLRYRPQFQQIARALASDCHVVFDAEADPVAIATSAKDANAIRGIARSFWFAARFHREQGEHVAAAESCLQLLRVGTESCRGGSRLNFLVCCAVNSIAHAQLVRCLPNLDESQIRAILNELVRINGRAESLNDAEGRDEAWHRLAYGWIGHLPQILSQISGEPPDFAVSTSLAWKRHQCIRNLIILECAIRTHMHEQQTLPNSLDDLLAQFVSEDCLLDPFAEPPQRLRYVVEADLFKLYSVGPDQIDDGGAELERDEADLYPRFFEQLGDFSMTDYRVDLGPEDPWLATAEGNSKY